MTSRCSPPAVEYVLTELCYSLDCLLSRPDLGHLGKGWIVRDTTTKLNLEQVAQIKQCGSFSK